MQYFSGLQKDFAPEKAVKSYQRTFCNVNRSSLPEHKKSSDQKR
jgi:hypothetical protein